MNQEKGQYKYEEYHIENDSIVLYNDRIYVPKSLESRKIIMHEMHNVPYYGLPDYQQTIVVIWKQYHCLGIKKYVAKCISKCLKCQKVNVEHRHPDGFL